MSVNDLLPREKAIHNGINSLTNSELVALVLKSGYRDKSVFEIADEIIDKANGFDNLLSLSYEELIEVKGINRAKALEILGILEISRRLSELKKISHEQLDSPEAIANWIRYNIAFANEERFFVIYLNSALRIIKSEVLFEGDKNRASVGIDVVLRKAILNKATSIIVGHNHPSEEVNPSAADIQLTRNLKGTSDMLGIKLLDHLIVSRGDFFSFKKNGLLC